MRRRYINTARDEGMTCNCQMYCTDGSYQNRNIRCSRATSCDDCCSRATHAFGCGRIAAPKSNTFMNAKGQNLNRSLGKITTIPELGIQVQPLNERQGGNPCTTTCRSRDYDGGNSGSWGSWHPAGYKCSDCCGGVARTRGEVLPKHAQRVCEVGTYNTAVAMLPRNHQRAISKLDRNFSGGGSQNAIWSGSQSNVGPQDRIFAGNYASGMQGNCPDGYEETANGGCVEIGLGDPSRERGCPRGQYRDRNGNCRSMQPGTYNAKTKRPPINPFAPTTLPYDPMGAKQIANPGCNPPCGKGEYCQGGQCYSGQPFARQKFISKRRR